MTHLLISAGADPDVVGIPTQERGSALVSPALYEELSSNSPLSGRIRGTVVGVLPGSFLLEPSELVSVSFVESAEIFATGEALALPADPAPRHGVDVSSDAAFVVSVALVVLALPVVFFVAAATRFGLERRRQRIRSLGLAGADRAQIRAFVLLESLSATLLGLVGGYLLFWLMRPLLARLQVGSRSTFLESLRPSVSLAMAVIGFVLVAAVIAALSGSRRLEDAPLETRGRRGRIAPGLVLLALGIAGLAVGVAAPTDTDAPHPLALVGMVLTAVGLAFVSRLLTGSLGRWFGTRTADGPTLLAARRMDRSPGEVNRPLIAVVTGVFVVAAFFTITGTLLRSSHPAFQDLPPTRVVVEAPLRVLTEIEAKLADRPGVQAVAVEGLVSVMAPGWSSPRPGVVADCEALIRVADIVTDSCSAGVVVAADERIPAGTSLLVGSAPPLSEPTATTSLEANGSTFEGAFPASVIIDPGVVGDEFLSAISGAQALVRFDPTAGDLEELRNFVVSIAPTARVRSVAEIEYEFSVLAREVRTLALVGLMVTLGVAAFNLVVGTASHLLQQRNALAFLRAGGLASHQIRKLIAFESIVPLAISTAIGAALGVGVGAAVAVSAGSNPSVPWVAVGLIYLSGVVLGALVWLAFVPTVDRLTSPTGLRFE
jgi:predicted lysophospholipase L1 biosynthesis ABC-type transport system permease subunit